MSGAYYPPLGITNAQAARAYVEQGTFQGAAEALGCSAQNVRHHVHRTTTSVRRSTKAFRHERGPNGGILRVRLRPDEEPTDTVPPPTR